MSFDDLRFRYQDPNLVALLIEKYQLTDQGVHRLTDDTDLKQIRNRLVNRLRDHDQTRGATIKRFMDQKTNKVEHVHSAWTNIDFDIFGFVKIVMPKEEGKEEEVVTIPYHFKGIKQDKLW